MIIYLAARYGRREELCKYREQLEQFKHILVNSRWLNGEHQISPTGNKIGKEGEKIVEETQDIQLRGYFAEHDFEDCKQADIIVSFTEPQYSSNGRGGRHVEFGIGLALNKKLVIIGYRENIFHCLPIVLFYKTFEAYIKSLEQEKPSPH